jgi:hypothetical protein
MTRLEQRGGVAIAFLAAALWIMGAGWVSQGFNPLHGIALRGPDRRAQLLHPLAAIDVGSTSRRKAGRELTLLDGNYDWLALLRN